MIKFDNEAVAAPKLHVEAVDQLLRPNDCVLVVGANEPPRRNAALVGFSMGGGEVARYLSRHGTKRVAKAALISSVIPYLLEDASNPDGVDQSVFDDMKQQIRKDRFAFLQAFSKMFYGVGIVSSPVSEVLLEWTFVLAIMASPKATLACVDDIRKNGLPQRPRLVHYPHACHSRYLGQDRAN